MSRALVGSHFAMRRSSSASRLQKIGPAIGARLEQTKQFFAGAQARSSSASGLRKLAPETGSEQDEARQLLNSSSASGLQKLGPAIGDRWDQFRRQIGRASGHRRHTSRSSSRPPFSSSWASSKDRTEETVDASRDGKVCESQAAHNTGHKEEEEGTDTPVANVDSRMPKELPLKQRLVSWPKWFTVSEVQELEILQQWVSQDVASQIDKDVPRTQPRWLGVDERRVLKRVLSAYAVMNPTVGYCQGMNNIVAVFIMLGFDEVAALHGFSSLVQKACPGYHDPGLEGYLRDVAVLEALVRSGQIVPASVCARLDALEVPLDVLASEHFISLASHSWPLAAVVQLWDLIFKEGSPAVFASFLALLQMYLPTEGGEQSPGGAIPGVVVDLEPVDVFRRAALRGVNEDVAGVLQRVRELIPKIPEALIKKLRDAQCGEGDRASRAAVPLGHI